MIKQDVLIIDYGLGNLYNIQNALECSGASVKISQDPKDITKASRIILPGVGAFHDGMKGLHEHNLIAPIKEFSATGKPILGVCLGMQLLLNISEEWGDYQGIGLVPGKVVKLKNPIPPLAYKIPHIGWNTLRITRNNPIFANNASPYMYFLHSYYAQLEQEKHNIAVTEYGQNEFCAAFQYENILGFQPHIERSGKAGLIIFKNFLSL